MHCSFDDCLGHPAPNGEYHLHVNPTCLYDDSDDQNHSPIIGYAFDNFPIYGAYGYIMLMVLDLLREWNLLIS